MESIREKDLGHIWYIDKQRNLGFGSWYYKKKNYPIAFDGDRAYLLSTFASEYITPGYADPYYIDAEDHSPNRSDVIGIYSINNHKLLNTDNYIIKSYFKRMFWLGGSKEFDVAIPLSIINDNDLGIVSDEEKKLFTEYVTCGNKDISREEVIDYLLQRGPILKNYRNLNNNLSVSEYRNIVNKIGTYYCYPKAIKQELDFIKDEDIYLPNHVQEERTFKLIRKKK